MKQVVVTCGIKAGERKYNTLNREFAGKQISYPWFCAKDAEIKSFLNDWSFYYDWQHKGVHVQYIVTLLFSTEAVHDIVNCKSGYDSCPHTIRAACDFLSKESAVQETVIDSLIEQDLYSDRLLFLPKSSPSEIAFQCGSIPVMDFKPDGSIKKTDYGIFYFPSVNEKAKLLSTHTKYTLRKIGELCKKGFSRSDVIQRDEFRVLIKEAIQQKSPHGT